MKYLVYILRELVTKSRSGIEDVIISIIPQAFTIFIGFLSSVLIARGLGPNGMGKYALIISIPVLVLGLSDLGIGQTAIRFASRAASHSDTNNQMAVLRWAFRTRIALVIFVSLMIFLLSSYLANEIWHDLDLTYLLRLSLLIGLFNALAHVPSIYFQSLKRFRINTIVSMCQTLISFFGILIIALLNSWSLEQVIYLSIASSGIAAFMFLILIPKSALFKFSELTNFGISTIKGFWQVPAGASEEDEVKSFAFFIVISSILVMLTLQADIWLMGVFLEKNQIGLYSVARNYTMPLVVLLSAINIALWPRASAITDLQDTRDLLHIMLKWSLLVSAFALVYSVVAPMTIGWVFGQAYSTSILLGQLLCVRYCISLIYCPLALVCYNYGFIRNYCLINLAQLLVVITINILLLPKIGAIGSAIALIACDLLGLFALGFITHRKIKCPYIAKLRGNATI